MAGTNTCMGIYEFSDKNKRIFNSIIKPLIETHTGLTYIDAMSYYESNSIKMDLINKTIEESEILIVDVSNSNPNVFFEFGIGYSMKKPIVIICSEESYNGLWMKKMPFDIKGRELLIFKDDNDLKVKLGKFISDSLFKTKQVTTSWISFNKNNHIKSSTEFEFFDLGEIWSNIAVDSNFTISYHVKVHENINPDKNPDIRLYFSNNLSGYPRITCIFPWELSEMDTNKYECHIDYFKDSINHERLQQVSVRKRNIDTIKDFNVFVSFYWPNLVFESTIFEDKIARLVVPKSRFASNQYPLHQQQFIGFSANCHVSIDNIVIKEIYI